MDITTTFKNLLDFSDDYSRSTATKMFWYEDKTQSHDSFESENEIERTFALVVRGGGSITTKQNNSLYSGLFRRFIKIKECQVVSMYLPLSRFFGFSQHINYVFTGVTHQII